jgi:hypothetical protein
MGPSDAPTDDEPGSRQVPRVQLGTWPPLWTPVSSRKAVEKAVLFSRQPSVTMRGRRVPCPSHQAYTMKEGKGQNGR